MSYKKDRAWKKLKTVKAGSQSWYQNSKARHLHAIKNITIKLCQVRESMQQLE